MHIGIARRRRVSSKFIVFMILGLTALVAPAVAQEGDEDVGWCKTFEFWFEKYGDQQPEGSNCPLQGTCDDPLERDIFIPDENTPSSIRGASNAME